MRVPHPPTSLTPAQIATYAAVSLVTIGFLVTLGLVVPIVGALLLALAVIAILCGLVYMGLALYNDHADRRTARQRIKPGELVMVERDGIQMIVDPQRSASPAIAISAAGITPLLVVDQPQQARNIQAAAVQLAQAAPSAGGRFAEMIQERTPPAQILLSSSPAPQLEAPILDLATTTVDLISRLQPDAGANNVLLGVDGAGTEVRGTLHDLMHTGLLAATNGGKTTALGSLALQLAHDPDVQLVIADPHLMELALLEDTGALRYGLPGNGKQAVQVLIDVAKEVHRRAELVNEVSQRIKELAGRRQVLHRLDRYNRAASHIGAEHLPALVCFGDEIRALAGLGPEADKALGTITSEGRKFGVYFIGASQSWKTSVIDSDVRSQFWTRICLPGATVRQTAELFEIDQAEARALTTQLTASGVAALWRRGKGTMVLKTPYVEMEGDRVYTLIEKIAAKRQPEPHSESISAVMEIMETFPPAESISSPLERDFPTFPNSQEIPIDVEKRDKVATLLESGKGKMAIISELWGVSSGRAYQTAGREYEVILESLKA